MSVRMYDLGGQPTERRKWLRCFDNVHAILFVVALSSFDMMLMEAPSMNPLQESLKLFTSICTNKVFSSSSLILFMNKTDLFKEKIQRSGRHLRLYLPSYKDLTLSVSIGSVPAFGLLLHSLPSGFQRKLNSCYGDIDCKPGSVRSQLA